MRPDAYLAAIRTSAARLAAAARTDIDAPVPSCPGWRVTDVVSHVGGVHGWAADIVASGQRAEFQPPPEGTTGLALVSWAEGNTTMLLDKLGPADPDAACWTFGLPRTVRFWLRRQALETTVHAWDAEAAVGDGPALDGDLAADGIDEFLDVMLPRQMQRNAGPWTGETVHFHRTDGPGEWLVTLGPQGALSVERDHAKGDLALRGAASDLYLWCLNRVGSTRLDLFGDEELAGRWSREVVF